MHNPLFLENKIMFKFSILKKETVLAGLDFI